jgi:ParB-like chromosome segregation protein Spo0J
MATTAARKKTVAAAPSKPSNFLFNNSEIVDIKVPKPHPRNPRIGNVDAVAESLLEHGQFKPIVVNKRNGFIAAGHHTWLGARKNGWPEISVVWIDVTEQQHLKIMLADNKTSDMGTYDDAVLAEILAGMEDLSGTGYSAAELQDLIDSVNAVDAGDTGQSADELRGLMDSMPKIELGKEKTKREQYEDGKEGDEDYREAQKARGAAVKPAKDEPDDAEEIDDIVEAEAELQAVLEVKVENFTHWKQSSDEYQIPELRDDLLMEEIPPGLETWGGHEVSKDDGEKWFLYNYSLGGIKGLPFDRSILCFYTYDEKFEGWWDTPAWYTSRILAKGCRNAVVPDFSFYYSQPRVVHLHNVYRAQWLGRYFQEAGMRVVPRLQFDYRDDRSLEIALRGIPRGCPVLATSQQNPEEKGDEAKIAKHLQAALDEIKPAQLIYYSGNPGRRAMEMVTYDGEVKYLMNFVGVRREVAFGVKAGLAGKTAKQRKVALDTARAKLSKGSPDKVVNEEDEEE